MAEKSKRTLVDYAFKVQDVFYEDRTQILLADFIKSSLRRNKVKISSNNGKTIYQFIS